ncbi:type II toxin-antitoxin system RelE/ParE family toxin [Rhodococcus pseudokoreensis]|uniref:Type II toxin-antitoxin system RelE/ParE family toxin n=1 Tax=Rhodococcus pseudokoreensis TaxID=2811421 RepID=A0A974ZX26_9NOCA|nr:type II toxin-antitoxin system RelE/ParE family toxin [Rhodococcus pseudokoreensis]QSE93132.1 type II toxin-antitoxin system RelE/ParE family toxin [Rhodococcus pseudokoreensis]
MSERYSVQVPRKVVKTIASLQRTEQRRIQGAIELLAENPRPPSCTAMVGYSNTYRVRVGTYRIIYEVRDRELIVIVIHVGHRRNAYR